MEGPVAIERGSLMHLTEGVAPLGVAVGGGILALAGVAIGLSRLKDDQVPRAALVAATVFVVTSVVRLPLGISSMHPVLCGLCGLLLGWSAVPVYLVCLLLQALLLQVGGLSTLGVNTVAMGTAAVGVHLFFSRALKRAGDGRIFFLGAAGGFVGVLIALACWGGALVLCGGSFLVLVKAALVPYLVLGIVEALFTGFVVSFLAKLRPDVIA